MKKIKILEFHTPITLDQIQDQLMWYVIRFDYDVTHNLSDKDLNDKLIELDNNTIARVLLDSGLDESIWDKDNGCIAIDVDNPNKTAIIRKFEEHLPAYLKLVYGDNEDGYDLYAIAIKDSYYRQHYDEILQAVQAIEAVNESTKSRVLESYNLDDITDHMMLTLLQNELNPKDLSEKWTELSNKAIMSVIAKFGLDESMLNRDNSVVWIDRTSSDYDYIVQTFQDNLPEYLKFEFVGNSGNSQLWTVKLDRDYYDDHKDAVAQSLQSNTVNKSITLDEITDVVIAKAVIGGFIQSDASLDDIINKYRELQKDYILKVIDDKYLSSSLIDYDDSGQPVVMLNKEEYDNFVSGLDSGFSLTEYRAKSYSRKPYVISINQDDPAVQSTVEEFLEHM